jgi:hypothetical protein
MVITSATAAAIAFMAPAKSKSKDLPSSEKCETRVGKFVCCGRTAVGRVRRRSHPGDMPLPVCENCVRNYPEAVYLYEPVKKIIPGNL